MARATAAGLTPLTKAQSLRLIDAWPCPVRIARDLDCPDCGFPELGQTFQSELPPLIYCRKCGWAIVPKAPKGVVGLELRERFGKYLLSVNRLPLVVLAAVAIRSWNPDLSVLERLSVQLTNKLLHAPTRTLNKHSLSNPELADAINRIYHLNPPR